MPAEFEFDVLIVGAGPAGLATASYLGMSGIRVLLVERNASTVNEARAVSIDDESLRSMQTLGVVEEITRNTLPGYGARYYAPGNRPFARVQPTTLEFGHPRRSAFHQPDLEAVLLQGLDRFPSVDMKFSHTFVGFTQDDAGVTATIEDADGKPFDVRVRYLAACDGGRSGIRKAIGSTLLGSSFEERWLVLDCINDPDDTPDSICYCDHRRPIISLPGPNRTRRWEFLLKNDEDADDVQRPERVRELLRPHIGDREAEIARRVVYTFHARVADKWQDGRVFLLGDAAHLTPPYAGQGMNSGQRDAANFAWKVAAVVKGTISPRILDTYETERRDHAWSLIKMAIQIGWVMVPRNWFHTWGQFAFFKVVGLIPALRNYFIGMKYKPVPRFREGFLVPDGIGAKRTLVGRMLVQPDVVIQDGSVDKLDDVMGPGFALLSVGGSPDTPFAGPPHEMWDRLAPTRLCVSTEAPDNPPDDSVLRCTWAAGRPPDQLIPYDGKILLVRPDRYVAAAFAPDEASHIAGKLAAMLA